MTRSVIGPQGGRELLRRERHHTLAGIDVHVELVEEVASEDAVCSFDRQILRAHGHAPDTGFADLQAVDEEELYLCASGGAGDLRRCRRSGDADPGRLEGAR